MRMRFGFLAGAAVGYVLGTRAGRQQFEQIKERAQQVWENPKVQENIHKAQSQATDFVKEKAPELKEKFGGGSSDAPDDLDTFTTAGSDETEVGGTSSGSSTSGTYPTGSEGNRI